LKISEVIKKVKSYCNGSDINDQTTRDQVLFGETSKECTGIVTTCWASVNVIKEAKKQGANLIICHEALFWNHGDHRDWLEKSNNETFNQKEKLLKEYDITVWRNHDYLHSGIPVNGGFEDGIFYGLAKILGWEAYIKHNSNFLMMFDIPKSSANEVAKLMIEKLDLTGVKIIGDPETVVKRVVIPHHVFGDARSDIISAEKNGIDLFLGMELVDYTLNEYIRDSSQLGRNKAIVQAGHFNLEEPGMKYFASYLPDILKIGIKCTYVQSGDMYHYVIKGRY